ncbi:two component transcriptional regulator, AraC family [Paenisporosarcina quisquiliarum]|nr:two component transcriptional regulator, AraC family [Paenisporosarcina quisquiliarum]
MYKLMIVEDEPVIRSGLKHYFDWKELGIQTIVEAENGKDGLDTALLELPHLVITDIRMPVMDGLEMIGHLRTKLPETLFIILTGHSEFEYAQRAIHYGGVHDYLLKPLQYEKSFSVIVDCIEKIRDRQLETLGNPDNSIGLGTSLILDKMESLNQEDIQLFKKIESYIKKHINQELTLNMVAEHFFYNPSYLSRLFKTKLNINYMTFVSEIRIRYALECLKNSKYSITDVSLMCGYKSYKHFVKLFKSVSHMTPTEYRKQLRI